MQNSSSPRKSLYVPFQLSQSSSYRQPVPEFYHHQLTLSKIELDINGIKQCVFFCVSIFSLTCFCDSLESVHILVVHSFLLLSMIPCHEYSMICFSILNGWTFGVFFFCCCIAVKNKAATNSEIQVFLQICDFPLWFLNLQYFFSISPPQISKFP